MHSDLLQRYDIRYFISAVMYLFVIILEIWLVYSVIYSYNIYSVFIVCYMLCTLNWLCGYFDKSDKIWSCLLKITPDDTISVVLVGLKTSSFNREDCVGNWRHIIWNIWVFIIQDDLIKEGIELHYCRWIVGPSDLSHTRDISVSHTLYGSEIQNGWRISLLFFYLQWLKSHYVNGTKL